MSAAKRPLIRRIGPALRAGWREITGKASAGARGYDGAGMGMRLEDWIRQARSADEDSREIRILRARARDMRQNNSYAKRYSRLLKNNVVGPDGILLQAELQKRGTDGVMEFDEDINGKIEAAWRAWAEAPVTLDRKLTLRRFERLLIDTIAFDGEAFVRIWKGRQHNPFGIALQPVDADMIDERFNREASPGKNEIRMGVEVDSVGRPVGYWLSNRVGTWRSGAYGVKPEFVPAEEMIHLYDPDRVNQTRGITWVHSIMVPAHMLNAYEESEAVAARVGASWMGFWERDPQDLDAPDRSGGKPIEQDATPGAFGIGPKGYKLSTFSPEHPTSAFPSFVKQMARKIASGLSVFYNVLANDAENVTYSTMRSFTLIENDDWRAIQEDFIDMWRRPLYPVWLRMADLTGRLEVPHQDFARYEREVVHWPRGWDWIDPEKGAKGAILSVASGIGTLTEECAKRGLRFEDVVRTRARENAILKKHDVTISLSLSGMPDTVETDDSKDDSEETGSSNGNGNGRGVSTPTITGARF